MLEAWRRAYGCDCSGPVAPDAHEALGRPVRAHLKLIERVAGHRPPTCPWRAFYDPLVREVVALAPFATEGNLGAAWGDDPPQLLIDAYATYAAARNRTLAEDEKLRAEQEKREIEAQKRRGMGRSHTYRHRRRG